jgi:hypothetical protein
MSSRTLIQLFLLTIFFLSGFIFRPAIASGVALSLTDGSGIPDGGSGGATEVNIGWTSSGFYATGTDVMISLDPATTSTIANCSTPSTAFGISAGSFSAFTSSSAVFTLAENVATSTAGSLCLRFDFVTSTAMNYSIGVQATTSTSGFTTTDVGMAMYSVLGKNQIQVTGSVPSFLSFSIRNVDDTADTNTCALGTLTLAAVNTCSYRLRIGTNAANGFVATIQTDGELTNGTTPIAPVVNEGSFVAGTESYGMETLVGATTGGWSGADFNLPLTEASALQDAELTFNVDATPLDFTSATTILSFNGPFEVGAAPSTTSTSLLTHGIAIGATTMNGSYSQTIVYRVTGSF